MITNELWGSVEQRYNLAGMSSEGTNMDIEHKKFVKCKGRGYVYIYIHTYRKMTFNIAILKTIIE